MESSFNIEERIIDCVGVRGLSKSRIRQAIINAYLLNPDGSIDTICKNARISRGTFFNYFDSLKSFKRYFLSWFMLREYMREDKFDLNRIAKEIHENRDLKILSIWIGLIEDNVKPSLLDYPEISYFYNVEDPCKKTCNEVIAELVNVESLLEVTHLIGQANYRDDVIGA